MSETNEYVLNSEPREPKRAPPKQLRPDEAVEPQPAWVDEFNRETSEDRERKQEDENRIAAAAEAEAMRIAELKAEAARRARPWPLNMFGKRAR